MDWDQIATMNVDGPMATTIEVCPEGEYPARIDDGDFKKWGRTITTENGPRHLVEVPCLILDDNVKAELGRDKVTARCTIWLDFDESGRLSTAKGKNVMLGQLREALGQNEETNWTFARLVGAGPFLAKVSNSTDKKNPERKYADVTRVTKI